MEKVSDRKKRNMTAAAAMHIAAQTFASPLCKGATRMDITCLGL